MLLFLYHNRYPNESSLANIQPDGRHIQHVGLFVSDGMPISADVLSEAREPQEVIAALRFVGLLYNIFNI